MIVCHCMRLTDRELREAVRAGCHTREKLAEELGAGGCCGGCGPALDEIVTEETPGPGLVFLNLAKSA
jgi:bacterioferritin-associated ferredoxin